MITAKTEDPFISISCITYNHAKYIRDAIEGFLMQKTTFPIEILIHDDASTDNTANIIREYERHYPNLIKPIYQTENQYSKKTINIWANITFPRARGKYIALCEGDDYWTDPYKLQKQIDFLEANSDFAICFHKVKILKNGRLIKDYITHVPRDVTTIEDLVVTNFMHTPSVVFRNGLIKDFPDWYRESPIGDYPLHLLNAQYGKIKYINEVMAVYRIHKGGIYSNRKRDDIEFLAKWVKTKEQIIKLFSGRVKENFSKTLAVSCLNLSELYNRKGDIALSKEMFKKAYNYDFEYIYDRYIKYKKFIMIFRKIKDFIAFDILRQKRK